MECCEHIENENHDRTDSAPASQTEYSSCSTTTLGWQAVEGHWSCKWRDKLCQHLFQYHKRANVWESVRLVGSTLFEQLAGVWVFLREMSEADRLVSESHYQHWWSLNASFHPLIKISKQRVEKEGRARASKSQVSALSCLDHCNFFFWPAWLVVH